MFKPKPSQGRKETHATNRIPTRKQFQKLTDSLLEREWANGEELVTKLMRLGAQHLAQEPPQEPQTSTDCDVQNVDNSFKDKTITVASGTTVVWIHDGNRPYTVTAYDGSFDSSTLNSGDSFKFTFSEPGTNPYYCRFLGGPGSTGMSGTIIVSE